MRTIRRTEVIIESRAHTEVRMYGSREAAFCPSCKSSVLFVPIDEVASAFATAEESAKVMRDIGSLHTRSGTDGRLSICIRSLADHLQGARKMEDSP